MALGTLSRVLIGLRPFEEAIIACQDGATIFSENGDRQREAIAPENLARTKARRASEAEVKLTAKAEPFRRVPSNHDSSH
jgi:hypothetical protein